MTELGTIASITYHPIGHVRSGIRDLRTPEEIRSTPSRIVLDPVHEAALGPLSAGRHVIVVYHLHRIPDPKSRWKPAWMERRTVDRPNPLGVTLARILAVNGPEIAVIGLDAVDGTPVLDIKPYQPLVDTPPVAGEIPPAVIRRPVIVLTGGPGGGKSTLIEDLRRDPEWRERLVFLPETASLCGFTQVSSREKLFQRLMVTMQIALEEGLDHSLQPADPRMLVCHRGSLDPLAFWLKRGWPEGEFFEFTGLSRSAHYHRYMGVLHLETSARGVPDKYTRWPHAHRPEQPEEAILLDRLLEQAWGAHPRYFKIDNRSKDWAAKSHTARDFMRKAFGVDLA